MKLLKFLVLSALFAPLTFTMLGNVYVENHSTEPIYYTYANSDKKEGIIPIKTADYDGTPANKDELTSHNVFDPKSGEAFVSYVAAERCEQSGYPYVCLPYSAGVFHIFVQTDQEADDAVEYPKGSGQYWKLSNSVDKDDGLIDHHWYWWDGKQIWRDDWIGNYPRTIESKKLPL